MNVVAQRSEEFGVSVDLGLGFEVVCVGKVEEKKGEKCDNDCQHV